jgi:hypothetical protein
MSFPALRLARVLTVALLPGLLTVGLRAQETAFSADFTASTINPPTHGVPTESSSAWVVGGTKDHNLGVIEAGTFNLDSGSTSAAFVEAASRFAIHPIELTEAGDFIRIVATFTAVAGILQGNANSQLGIGVFDSGGVNPPDGVSGQIRFDQGAYPSGGMQGWLGYSALFENTGGVNRLSTRPAQAVTTNSASQELLFTGNTGAYTGRADLATEAGDGVTLADGTVGTIVYTLTLTTPDTLELLVELFAGADASGTRLTTVRGAATGANLLTTRFDALGLGYIRKGVSGTSRLSFSALDVLTNKPNFPARIESGPSNLTITVGGAGSLAVSVSGNELITYAWYKDGELLVDETGASLAFTDADASIEGSYHVVVTNAFGSDTSVTAVVSVTDSLVAPSVQEQPAGAILVEGEGLTLTVLANGSSPLSYDWKKGGASLGAPDQPSFTLPAVTLDDAGSYTVAISNSVGTVESAAALVEVWSVPAITAFSSSLLVDPGEEVVLAVTATGVPAPTYRWYRNGAQIPGETGATLTLASVSGAQAGSYRVEAENGAGVASSPAAVINVRSSLALTGVMGPTGTGELPPDVPVVLTFDAPVQPGFAGRIELRDASARLVDAIDLGASSQRKSVGGLLYHYDPILIEGTTATVVFPGGALAYGTTYYVTLEPGAIVDASGATFIGVDDASTIRFTTRALAPAADATLLRVAADGSGDFATVQGAIDHVPANNARRVLIHIAPGTYRELLYIPANKPRITLQGTSREACVISYLNNANRNASNQRASFWTRADDLVIDSLTFVNTTPKGGSQAETLNSSGDRVVVRDSAFHSLQDTLKIDDGGVYFHACYIEGDVDFMWGDARVFFDRCTIHTVNRGYLVQVRNGQAGRGFVFVECVLTGEAGAAGTYLGRIDPGVFPYSEAVFIDCRMGPHIHPAGWLLNNATAAPTVRFYEHGSMDLAGNPLDLGARLAAATLLDPAAAAPFRDPQWVTGFDPALRAWTAGLKAPQASGWAWDRGLGWVWLHRPASNEPGNWAWNHALQSWIYLLPSPRDEAFFYAHRAEVAGWYWSARSIGPWVWRAADGEWLRLTASGLE